jgi:heme/copper-type cytochrome/quinol oxidase subunit 2
MYRSFIKKNTTSVAILLFIGVFFAIQYFKPKFMFKNDGTIRQFGIGYKEKTILPVWLIAIVIAILSYVFVMYYLAMPRIRNF